jgi:hypothetical protein
MRCAISSWRSVAACVLAVAASAARAQDCPRVDVEAQKARQAECLAAGGQWSRFGVRDHLCGVYSCAPRTADGGKPCRSRSECDYLCIYDGQARVGAEVAGRCAAFRTSFGCLTHVDGGRVVGRVCVD